MGYRNCAININIRGSTMIHFGIWASLPQKIKDEHGPRLQAYFPNTETVDKPGWVDPEDGTEAPQVLKYTDAEWLDKCTAMYFNRCSAKGQIIIDKKNNVNIDPIE